MSNNLLDSEKLSVLVVDDRKENLLAMECVLKTMGVNVILANSGNECLSKLLRYDVSIILLDVQMPEMDGYETAGLIRQHDKTKAIPIIFITAGDKEHANIEKGYESGAVDFLFKPVDSFILKSKIKIFIDLLHQKNLAKSMLAEKSELVEKIKYKNMELDRAAHYDSLTDLPNRLHFEKEITRQIAHAKRHSHQMALLFVDLDYFKNINDTLGHYVGDLLLKEVSMRLKSSVRIDDFISRIGGDEFAIILTLIKDTNDAAVVCQKLLDTLSRPYELAGHELRTSISIGIATYPHSGDSPTAMVKHADIAMYRAKDEGRNDYKYFTEELNTAHLQRLKIENALRYALEHNEFYLVYQPVVNISTGALVGMEVLLRWEHPDYGLISPAEFIPIAEEIGIIAPIGNWIFNTACKQYNLWNGDGSRDLIMSINLSPCELKNELLMMSIKDCMEKGQVEPKNFQFELTETAIMANIEESGYAIKQFHEMGFKIAIDDFGTGYSSLSRLRSLPFRTVKIDRSFVNDIGEDENDTIVVKSMISLAHGLELDVVAEGVETEEQRKFLTEHGCQYAQGYFFSKPLVTDDMTKLLQSTKDLEKTQGITSVKIDEFMQQSENYFNKH